MEAFRRYHERGAEVWEARPVTAQLKAIKARGLLAEPQLQALREGWQFLQQLGSCLRMVEDRSISDLDGLARRLGYRGQDRESGARRLLLRDYRHHTKAIRSVYEDVLADRMGVRPLRTSDKYGQPRVTGVRLQSMWESGVSSCKPTAVRLSEIEMNEDPERPTDLPEELDTVRLSEAALGILSLTLHDGRVWKALDWNLMNILFEKGWICDPISKAKSVVLTDEGERLAHSFLVKHFGSTRGTDSQ